MKNDRLLDDQDLKAAFRSVRDAYDGENPESNLTLQRALFRTRTRERRSKLTRWVVLPIAAVLAASTAWAGVTGKLTPAVQSMLEAFHAEHAPPPSPIGTSSVAPPVASLAAVASAAPSTDPTHAEEPAAPSTAETPAALPVNPPSVAVAPIPVGRPSAVAHSARPAASELAKDSSRDEPSRSVDPTPSPTASAADPHAGLFAEAHRLHFKERNPAEALAAWDRYLAVAPNGRFSPEARYNRALALVRLGRHAEARSELTGFATGTYGSYRREDAKALLDALSRDASTP
jgi:hypothetical protein